MTIKVHILHCGQVRVDRSVPFYEKTINPFATLGFLRGKKYQIWLPVSAYLIEHPKGLILIDTGWHRDVRTDQKKHLGWLHYHILKADLPAGQAIDEQLLQLGYRPRDIDYLVMSHLHSDHASGMKIVKEAKKILVSENEWQETIDHRIHYIPTMWEGLKIDMFKFQPSDYGEEHPAFDLFGDGSLVFISTPGHTMGLASTLIQNNGRFLLLVSDTGYARKSWEEMIMPGMFINRQKVLESLAWVRKMSQERGCMDIIANHDPEVMPGMVEV